LEYRLLGAGVSSLLEEDVASCAAAREDLFALGTKSGRVHVFSHAGDFCSRARRLSSASPLDRAPTHAAPVTGVAFDARGEHVASCAADGTVSVARLGRRRRPARERSAADAGRGVSVVFAGEHDCAALAVALDPRETDAARRCVVVGLADGRLVVRTFASEPPGARGARDESSGDFGDCSSVRDSAKNDIRGPRRGSGARGGVGGARAWRGRTTEASRYTTSRRKRRWRSSSGRGARRLRSGTRRGWSGTATRRCSRAGPTACG
jgi:hypothetical protein